MSGLEITLLVLGLVFIGGTFTALEVLINRKYHEAQKANDDAFWDLITEFDEMGYAPTTFCDDPEKEAQEFKKRLIKTFYRKK